MSRIHFVFGTRPEVIKLAPVIHECRRRQASIQVIHTGQHPDLTPSLLEFFDLRPDLDLAVGRSGLGLSGLAHRMLSALESAVPPGPGDWVVVQGDTSSAFAGAYWGFSHGARVAHVEAGLRTHLLHSPFPEEAHRQMIARLATLHFAPTVGNHENLLGEGIDPSKIHVTGNSGIDALLWTLKRLQTYGASQRVAQIRAAAENRKILLVTMHRRENLETHCPTLCRVLGRLLALREDLLIVWPLHPHPRLRAMVSAHLRSHPRLILQDPMSYPEFVELMTHTELVMSDSGGVQEEAPTLGVKTLALREKTERAEGLTLGWVKKAQLEEDQILAASLALLSDETERVGTRLYGDGRSASRIVDRLLSEVEIPALRPLEQPQAPQSMV